MPSVSEPTYAASLADYFRTRLQECGRALVPPPQQDTLWYLGDMLARFGDSDQLFSYDRGEVGIRPLALLYRDAHETANPRQRCLVLRQLGDLALFLGALFPENYARRGIRRDYFVGMGGGAYDYLADNARHNRHIFSELASMFACLLDLVARACSREQAFDAADILDLYQRWRRTGDPRLAEQLHRLGISVADTDRLH